MWILPKTLSAFAPDTEALNLDLNSLGLMCEQSLLVRSKPMRLPTWLKRWKQGHWSRFLFGRTLKPSTADRFVEKYTASLAVIPVNHSVMPDSEKEPKTLDTFGRIYANTSTQLDLFGSSSKTSPDTSPWDSTRFTRAYEVWATQLRLDSLRRQKSAQPTKDNGCLSWPTPEAFTQRGPIRTELTEKGFVSFHGETRYGAKIADAVRVMDGLPAQDSPNTNGKGRGQLNPAWAEQLMGLPQGWTDLDSSETE